MHVICCLTRIVHQGIYSRIGLVCHSVLLFPRTSFRLSQCQDIFRLLGCFSSPMGLSGYLSDLGDIFQMLRASQDVVQTVSFRIFFPDVQGVF